MSKDEIRAALEAGARDLDEVDFAASAWDRGMGMRRRRRAAAGAGLTTGVAALVLAVAVWGGGVGGAPQTAPAITPTQDALITESEDGVAATEDEVEVIETATVTQTPEPTTPDEEVAAPAVSPPEETAEPTVEVPVDPPAETSAEVTSDAPTTTSPSAPSTQDPPAPSTTEPAQPGPLVLAPGSVGGIALPAPADEVLPMFEARWGAPREVSDDHHYCTLDPQTAYRFGDTSIWVFVVHLPGGSVVDSWSLGAPDEQVSMPFGVTFADTWEQVKAKMPGGVEETEVPTWTLDGIKVGFFPTDEPYFWYVSQLSTIPGGLDCED